MPRVRLDASGTDLKSFGTANPDPPVNPGRDAPQAYVPFGTLPLPGATPTIDRTYKLFIGGKQARPDATYVRIIKGAKGQVSARVERHHLWFILPDLMPSKPDLSCS